MIHAKKFNCFITITNTYIGIYYFKMLYYLQKSKITSLLT